MPELGRVSGVTSEGGSTAGAKTGDDPPLPMSLGTESEFQERQVGSEAWQQTRRDCQDAQSQPHGDGKAPSLRSTGPSVEICDFEIVDMAKM